MKNDNITIYDIAREAGVSPATVSRVLNSSANVKSEKKERVLELVAKYNFIPNAMAQGLSNQATKTIGVLLADIRNPFYAVSYVGIETAAIEKGYNVILCNALNDDATEQQHLEMLESKSVDAIIMIGGHTDDVQLDDDYKQLLLRINAKVPVIIAGQQASFSLDKVCIDDRPGMEALMGYLIGLGHRSFALVGGISTKEPTLCKQRLFREILQRNNLPFNEGMILTAPNYDQKDGYNLVKKMLRGGAMPTAIIGINELTALGALNALTEAGLSVPGDISVAGFDDTYLSSISMPQLTSVGCQYDEFGEKLMDMVMERLSAPGGIKTVRVPSGLNVRRSCAAPKAKAL